MSGLRSEARTDQGWQRFDRVAGLVSLLLVFALLILWFARTDIEKSGDAKATSQVAELTEPDGQSASPAKSADTDSKLETAAAVLPGTMAPKVEGKSDELAMGAPAGQKDADKSADQKDPAAKASDKQDKKADSQLAKSKIDISKKEIETAAKKETAKKETAKKKTEQKKVEEKKAEKPEPKKEEPKAVANARKATDAGKDSGKEAGADSASGMSLASQDPARQATFERIPKYIDKSITAAGSLAAAGQVADSGAGSLTSANKGAGESSAPASATETAVERSASSLVSQVPKVNSVLELSSSDGRLSIDGIVSSEQVRASILKAGLQAYGMRNLTDRLSVNEAVAPFGWAENASDLIVLIGGPESETTVRVDGQTVTLTGQVNELGDKQSRALAAQQLFGTRARVDNRLKVVPKPKPAKVAKTETETKPTPPVAKQPVAKAPEKAPEKKPEPKKPEPKKPEPKKPAAPATAASGQDPSQLAEGGPGQSDKVVMAPRGMPKKFARGDCPRVMTGVRVRFRSATVDISEDGRSYLDRLARCFRSRSYIVRGHTDSRGAALNNLILSQERAQAVVDYLISIGVSPNRVSAKGYGESTPVDSNRSERGRARNRRIDFRFKR